LIAWTPDPLPRRVLAGSGREPPKTWGWWIDTEELLRNIAALLRLDWIHAALEDERQPPIDGQGLEQNVTPPVHELQLLHALACEGDMRQIIRWAERVSHLDERYALFTDQVSGLARHYQSRAVLRLVEQHLDSGG
jgi:hypothetical protein